MNTTSFKGIVGAITDRHDVNPQRWQVLDENGTVKKDFLRSRFEAKRWAQNNMPSGGPADLEWAYRQVR